MEEKKYADGVVFMDLSCNVIAISPISGYIPPYNFVLEGWGGGGGGGVHIFFVSMGSGSLWGIFQVSRLR